jgi:peroxiredoxin
MKKTILLLMLAALTLSAGSLVGRRAASFTLPESSGRYWDLLDFRGKVVLLDVMKTTCPHCQVLSKTLERVKQRYGQRIQIISIVTPPDNPKSVAEYIARYKVTSPIVFDCGQASAALLRITPQNPSVDLPHLIVVDGNGMIRDDWAYTNPNGEQKQIFEGNGLFPIIDRLLAETGKPAASPARKK